MSKQKLSSMKTIASTKNLLYKHAKNITNQVNQKTQRASTALKMVAPIGRNPKAIDNSDNLKQYANLTKRGTSKRMSKSEMKRKRRAEYLSSLPKHPLKRIAYRLHPKRFFAYWFSRQGGLMALKIFGIGLVISLAVIGSVFAYFAKGLPDPRKISIEQSARIYDRTGKTLLYTYGGDTQTRTIVEFDQISDYSKWATLAIEDKDFYKHGGFSVSGVARAVLNNALKRDATSQGGSTITQQFIKNAVIKDTTQSYTRKIKELILSVELERLYTKDEILSFYLNWIPYGAMEYGIEAGANGFFGKPANKLTIDEAALMAALPQAPSYYSPYGQNTDDLMWRSHYIIDKMVEQKYISPEDGDKAKEVDTLKKIIPLNKRSAYKNIKAPHFVFKVIDDLTKQYSENTVQTGGLRVITTLDLDAQKIAEDVIRERYEQGGAMGDNAALVAEDVPTGQVIAYVGSRDFNFKGYGTYDAATPEIGRQPGSSFKPYAYAEMFKNPRWSPGSIIWDSPTNFNGYAPHDFDFKWPGPMKIRDAIGRSRNIPAVKSLYIAGVNKVVKLANTMGLESLKEDGNYGLSLVLGSGEVKLSEHVHGFGTFARGGVNKKQTYILEIRNGADEVWEEWKDNEGEKVLDPQIAYSITNILTDDVARSGTFGLGSRLVIPGYTVAAKTGTTDLSVDGWLMGYSRYVAAGVWVGNHDSKPMYTYSEPMTGPIWNNFMTRYHNGKKDLQFDKPEGIKTVRIDRSTGRNATDKTSNVIVDIAPSWFKGVPSEDSTRVTIDTVSNKLATECTPERAKKVVSNTGIAPELEPSDPMFAAFARGAGYGANSTSITEKDDAHSCDDAKPTITNFKVTGSNGNYLFEAEYSSGKADIDTVEFKVNGNVVKSCKVSSSDCTRSRASFNYASSETGNVKVVVEIVDKLLYSDDATENTAFSEPSPISIQVESINCTGDICTAKITWDNVPGADHYTIDRSPCSTSSCEQDKNSENFSFDGSKNSTYVVEVWAKNDDDGIISSAKKSIQLK